MTPAATVSWFAGHEIRLARREWLAMMTAGRRWRGRSIALVLIVFVALMHLPAYAVVGRFAGLEAPMDKSTLIVVSTSIFLAWALMLSQAIESVTRICYARADLDLIVSSPVALPTVFSVRLAAVGLTVTAMALLLATPFIDVLVIGGGARWFAVYGVVVAIGLLSTAVAIAVTVTLFRSFGPRRTRLVAQIFAAITGAGFVIGLQIAAIVSFGTLSRFTVLTSGAVASWLPEVGSPIWLPALALVGDGNALLLMLGCGLAALGVTIAIYAPRFGDYVASAAAPTVSAGNVRHGSRPFRGTSRRRTLRMKEFRLLRRDPWLVSQTLMQLLYLLPPALMLWRSFADNSAAVVLIAPILVMAAGQLAGGLAWLTISGEDAADLVATAPLPAASVIGAKVEVVLIVIGVVFAPLLAALALAAPVLAGITAVAVVLAATSATAIQLWFRVQARRSQFRRRQTSSRIATFAEAFSSIGWAASAALAVLTPVVALITALMTGAMLAMVWKISPDRA
jgi:ABC-2 type transport system permease protein